MSATGHPPRAPDVGALIAALAAYRVRYVLVGSVAAMAHGVAVEPGDLDVAPSLERSDLERLAALLREIEASIDGRHGTWTEQPDGRMRWIETPSTDAERAARAAAWSPHPDDPATFDHLFRTRLGNFDVTPEIAGAYAALAPRAVRARFEGHEVQVAPVGDLLERLAMSRREKDVERIRALRALQARDTV